MGVLKRTSSEGQDEVMRKIFAKKVTSEVGPKEWMRFQSTAFIGRGNNNEQRIKEKVSDKSLQSLLG